MRDELAVQQRVHDEAGGIVREPDLLAAEELKYAACELLRIPLPDDAGLHAGPTFEVVP